MNLQSCSGVDCTHSIKIFLSATLLSRRQKFILQTSRSSSGASLWSRALCQTKPAKTLRKVCVNHLQGAFFNCSSEFSVPKWKNNGQPIRNSVPWNSRCTKDPGWLNNVFLFSTEIWAEQLKKAPCIYGRMDKVKNAETHFPAPSGWSLSTWLRSRWFEAVCRDQEVGGGCLRDVPHQTQIPTRPQVRHYEHYQGDTNADPQW